MYVGDTCTGCGSLVVQAPAEFTGDLSAYVGIQWDEYLFSKPINGNPTYPQLQGPDGTVYAAEVDWPPDEFDVWRTRFVPFEPQYWNVHGADTFESVLQNVERLRIVMETGAGQQDESGVDNVMLITSDLTPFIYRQPQDQTLLEGQRIALNVGAARMWPLTYQWRKGGTDIPGASSSVLLIDSALVADSGDYDVTITNQHGSLVSDIATVTVQPTAPIVITHPVGGEVCAGAVYALSVTAIGSPPLSYQWKKDSLDIGGATGSSYNVGPASAADAGEYTVEITNVVGSETSDPATITVNSTPPIILQHPQNLILNVGDYGAFTAVVQACGPVTYQWYRDGYPLAGSTGPELFVKPQPWHAGSYWVSVHNAVSTVFSNHATLTVTDLIGISGLGGSQTLYVSESTTLSLLVLAEAPLDYQWRKDGVPLPNGSGSIAMGAIHALQYPLGPVDFVDAGTYDLHVSHWSGAKNSDPEVIDVLDAYPAIAKQPRGESIFTGESLVLSVEALGLPPLTYQWRKDEVDISGATSETYEIQSALLSDAGSYDVVVSGLDVVYSDAVPVTVTEGPPSILQHPASHSFSPSYSCTGLLVMARGSLPMQYEWRKDDVPIPGETSPHLDLGLADLDAVGTYDVVVTNAYGTVFSEPAVLTADFNMITPVAVVAAGPTYGYAPLTVRFDASQSSSFEPICGTLDYEWDFGDSFGAPVPPSAPAVEHTYEQPGVYVARLTVRGNGVDVDEITISVTDGPYIGARDEDLFQDGFPNDGALTTTSSIRLDMARDISQGFSIVPGDSILVDIVSVVPGATLLDPPGGFGGVLHWTMVANPAYDSERAAGLSSVGATLAGTDSRGWNIWQGEVFGTESTAPGTLHRCWFDLADGPPISPHQSHDSPMFFPGDVLQYYVRAEDDAGHVTTLPAHIGDFGNFEDGTTYDRRFTVRGLPTLDPVLMTQPEILIWNDAGHGDEEHVLLMALRNNGYRIGEDYDVYTTQGPEALVSNGLGSSGAHGATPGQLDGYSCLIYTAGHLDRGLINDGSNADDNDKSDDVGLLTYWGNGNGDRFHVYFGSNLADDLGKNGPTLTFLGYELGVYLVDPEVRRYIDYQARPPVAPTGAASPWFSALYVANAGLPAPVGFDWISPLTIEGAMMAHEFLQTDGTPYPPGPDPYAASVLWDRTQSGWRKATLVFPHSFSSIIDMQGEYDGDARPARANLLQEILDYFGFTGTVPSVTGPTVSPGKIALDQNRPNPFNPSTQIVFRTPGRGEVTVKIYDIRGQFITTVFDEVVEAGEQRISWNGTDRNGIEVSSGVYLVEVRALGQRETKKMVLVR